ncbi:MAG: HU family DNA-binding protein [Armatimonadota bacterium]|nr:HU family DNA-binding protein [Armatimonadota bacterium]
MTKTDLVEAIAERAELTKADAGRALEAFLETISKALSRGWSVQITGFGTFERRTRKARKARNLQTGEEIEVPETKVPAFRAGKTLKDMVK